MRIVSESARKNVRKTIEAERLRKKRSGLKRKEQKAARAAKHTVYSVN